MFSSAHFGRLEAAGRRDQGTLHLIERSGVAQPSAVKPLTLPRRGGALQEPHGAWRSTFGSLRGRG